MYEREIDQLLKANADISDRLKNGEISAKEANKATRKLEMAYRRIKQAFKATKMLAEAKNMIAPAPDRPTYH